MREFSTFLESIGPSTSGNLLMEGDFNLQVATPDPIGHLTLSLMNSFNLFQHVTAPTHSSGHLLDLFFFSRATISIVASTWVSDMFSDNCVVQCSLRLARPLQPTKKVTFRAFKSIFIEEFAEDLASLPLFTDPASTPDG